MGFGHSQGKAWLVTASTEGLPPQNAAAVLVLVYVGQPLQTWSSGRWAEAARHESVIAHSFEETRHVCGSRRSGSSDLCIHGTWFSSPPAVLPVFCQKFGGGSLLFFRWSRSCNAPPRTRPFASKPFHFCHHPGAAFAPFETSLKFSDIAK